jgi:L-threonylcarbamoyladenylate synthase
MRSAFEACIRSGGVAVFPADTVYGLACDPENPEAVAKLYALKGRAPDKPSALMVFTAAALPTLPPGAEKLLPGPVTLLVPDGAGGTLGIRYPANTPLEGAQVVVLQSSANHSGEPDARTPEEVPEDVRRGADLVLGAGPLPGTPSTVIDFTGEDWRIVREGALPAAEVLARLRA